MKTKKIKPHQLFDDLAEKQRIVKAKMGHTTAEEARALAKWLKEPDTIKKTRPEDTPMKDSNK